MHIPAFVRPLFNLYRAAQVAPAATKNLQEGNQASFKYQRIANEKKSVFDVSFANKANVDRRQTEPLIQGHGTKIFLGKRGADRTVRFSDADTVIGAADNFTGKRAQPSSSPRPQSLQPPKSLSPLSKAVYEAGISNLLPAKRLAASNKAALGKTLQANKPVGNALSRMARTVLAPRELAPAAARDDKPETNCRN